MLHICNGNVNAAPSLVPTCGRQLHYRLKAYFGIFRVSEYIFSLQVASRTGAFLKVAWSTFESCHITPSWQYQPDRALEAVYAENKLIGLIAELVMQLVTYLM